MGKIGSPRESAIVTPQGWEFSGLAAHRGCHIVFADDFSGDGLAWKFAGNASIATDQAMQGNKCLRLQTPGVAAKESAYAEADIGMIGNPVTEMRVSCRFRIAWDMPNSTVNYVEFWCGAINVDDTKGFVFKVRFDVGNKKWIYNYGPDTQAWKDLPTQPDGWDDVAWQYTWYHFLAVVSLTDARWKEITINNTRNLVTDPCFLRNNTASPIDYLYVLLQLRILAGVTASETVEFDNVIISVR